LTFTVAAIAAAFGFTVQPAYAPPPAPCANCGASELAPGEEPQAPGWDPSGAEEDAPGQLAEIPVPTCHNCAKEFAPGDEGLEAGIIGPDKKIILD
jgi:hypothetical protein